jgi:hypothetical protein
MALAHSPTPTLTLAGCPLSKDPTSTRAGTGGPEGGTSFTTSDGKTITRNGGE